MTLKMPAVAIASGEENPTRRQNPGIHLVKMKGSRQAGGLACGSWVPFVMANPGRHSQIQHHRCSPVIGPTHTWKANGQEITL